MDKPGSWILLAKRHSSTGVFQIFGSKNQLAGFYISGILVENGLNLKESNSSTLTELIL